MDRNLLTRDIFAFVGNGPKGQLLSEIDLQSENGGFSTFTGVFGPGNGESGALCIKFGLAFSRDASNDV